jgi:hypothetical protein
VAQSPNSQPTVWASKPDATAFEKIVNDRLAEGQKSIDKLVAVKGARTIENTLVPYDEAIEIASNGTAGFHLSLEGEHLGDCCGFSRGGCRECRHRGGTGRGQFRLLGKDRDDAGDQKREYEPGSHRSSSLLSSRTFDFAKDTLIHPVGAPCASLLCGLWEGRRWVMPTAEHAPIECRQFSVVIQASFRR